MKARVSIIGAGHAGTTKAQLILQSGLTGIALYDIMKGVPQRKGLDLTKAAPLGDMPSLVHRDH